MILQRRGDKVVSVVPNFNSRALTEIVFRPEGAFSEPVTGFDAQIYRERTVSLHGEADDAVQATAESAALDQLLSALLALEKSLAPGAFLFIESASPDDWPKTRERRQDVVIAGENRFHFHWRIDPPLRVSVCRTR